MKYPWFAAAIAAVSFVLASAGTPFAGVVMAETSTAQAPNGATFSENKTIYIQGNKQKIEKQDVTVVTDLDKSVIYIIDKNGHVYTEMPLGALGPAQSGNVQSETILLNKTGETRVIADQRCDEYRGVEGNKLEHVTIKACVSTRAPGAKDMSEFERKMVARLSSGKPEGSADSQTTSLMLDKQSVLSFRVPDPSRDRAYRTASLLTETRINKIQLKPLPPETFKPPKGYNKLQNRPRTAPQYSLKAPDQNEARDQNIDAVAPDRTGYSRVSQL